MEKTQEEKLVNALGEVATLAKTEQVSIFKVASILLKHLGTENIKSIKMSGEQKIPIEKEVIH